MSRRRQHFRKLLGKPIPRIPPHRSVSREAWNKSYTASQCGGDKGRVIHALPSKTAKDKFGNVCSLPMKEEKRRRILRRL